MFYKDITGTPIYLYFQMKWILFVMPFRKATGIKCYPCLSFSHSILVSMLVFWVEMSKCFEIFAQCFWRHYTDQVEIKLFLFFVPGLSPLNYWKIANLVFSFSVSRGICDLWKCSYLFNLYKKVWEHIFLAHLAFPTSNQDGCQAQNRKKGGWNFNCPLLL